MKIHQLVWKSGNDWQTVSGSQMTEAHLVLAFGHTHTIQDANHFEELKKLYPSSHILLCSTAGEISGTDVYDGSIVATAIFFEKTSLQFISEKIEDPSQSRDLGKRLAEQLPKEHLIHALVFSEGLKVNGSALIQGLNEGLPQHVSVTGGLVGDGPDFKETLVGLDAPPTSGNIVLIGLYGENMKIGYGSFGGWDPFGPERLITKSNEHVLYELDGKNALALYKEYLGDKTADLPASGLLFPLAVKLRTNKGEVEVVRTLLAVNEQEQSLTFAGDLPEGSYARLMKANFERLIDGAGGAANMSIEHLGETKPELALLISCVGRKLVLGARTEEEIEAVAGVVGSQAVLCGFYSYGEICPTAATEKQCQLHNQTMTITTLRED